MADDAAALLSEAGLNDWDFSTGILSVYRSAMTERIAVIVRAPLHGSPLNVREPENLYTVIPGEGTLTYFFNPVLKS